MARTTSSRILCVLLLVSISCERKSHDSIESAAFVAGEQIKLSEVDNTIQTQLYERLFDIYYNRKIALDELLAQKVLIKEAAEQGVSVDSIIAKKVRVALTAHRLSEYIKNYQLEAGIPLPSGEIIKIESTEGQRLLKEEYKKTIIENYIDSLKKKFDVKFLLSPPLPPRLNLEGVKRYSLNDAETDVEISIVSDFSCSKCHDLYPIILRLVEHFGNRVSFSYIHLSNEPSIPILFSECASNQIHFATLFRKLNEAPIVDHEGVRKLCMELGLNFDELEACMNSDKEKNEMLLDFNSLVKQNISLTPTLLIDQRVYYGQMTFDDIKSYMKQFLEDHQD